MMCRAPPSMNTSEAQVPAKADDLQGSEVRQPWLGRWRCEHVRAQPPQVRWGDGGGRRSRRGGKPRGSW